MKYSLLATLFLILFGSCKNSTPLLSSVANNKEELYKAISDAEPGANIIMANSIWKDVEIKITKSGTKDKPITLSAETPGDVLIQGQSNLQLGGDYIIVKGLYFVNGYSPSRSVIHFAVNDTIANHCIVTNCVIKDYNKMQRNHQDLWVLLKGKHNQLDHCYLTGKSNRGPTIRVDLEGNQNINNYHQIINNHFGPRPPKGGPSAETIQIGNSYTSMCPSYTLVANNLFDECNGEVEVISSKTNFNEFRNNVFYQCEGSLVTRHGNYCTIDGNYFIGDENTNVGGIRLINTGHWVTNNYFYNLKGESFRSPLAVMNGIPKSPLNRYNQVTDVVVAHNTWVNCKSPWQFGVGTNISQAEVLPLSEIRSAIPIRTTVANNLIYNDKGDKSPIVAHDKISGIKFKNNLINNQNISFDKVEGLTSSTIKMDKMAEYIFTPSTDAASIELYQGFGFEKIKSRMVGATIPTAAGSLNIVDKQKDGADWFSNEQPEVVPQKHMATITKGDLAAKIKAAKSGDIIELTTGSYKITNPLVIDKKITIQSKGQKVTLHYSGGAKTPLFEMHPKGNLVLKNVIIKGENTQYAFASLQKNMSSLYNLTVENVDISNFNYVLKAYKESFADAIIFRRSILKDCENGIELSEEKNDKGDYNVEFLTIDNCQFENIKSNVIDYYRGGYDESTIGGNLSVTNNAFTNCGGKEENGILLNTRGIINVDISKNTFNNNPVKLVALLWGAKNNTHRENEINNSGKIRVEENLKLKLVY